MANDLIRNDVVLRLTIKATAGRADFALLEKSAQSGAAAIQSGPPPGPGGPGGPGGGPGRRPGGPPPGGPRP